jgi:hypothetical protein
MILLRIWNLKMNLSVEELAILAQEVEVTDPIEWGMLSIDERTSYRLMAANVLELFEGMEKDQQLTIALASITKLLVENFVLNLKLETRDGQEH